jgi:hypothetical protein
MANVHGGNDNRRTAREVAAAYVAAKDSARVSSPFWLRWRVRYLARQDAADRLDDCGVATLRAAREELAARGLGVPA